MFTRCDNCLYWTSKPGEARQDIGICRRHAPSAGVVPVANEYNVVWPMTSEEDGCGDGESRVSQ
jgi:hypothetical protein